MSTSESSPADLADLLYARMSDAPDTLTVNDAPLGVALDATALRAEQPAEVSYPAEPMPPLAPPTGPHGM